MHRRIWLDDGTDVAETSYTPFKEDHPDPAPVRLIVRRVRPAPGPQLEAFVLSDYHAFITDRDAETLELEADHRRQAEVENAIHDLKYGVGLNHLPSGRFAANGAWLAIHKPRPLGGPDRTRRADRHDEDAPGAIGWRVALIRLRAIPLQT